MSVKSAFKAYDVRGSVPEQLNPALAWAIGVAFAEIVRPKSVVVGRDCRLSGPPLCDALVQGLRSKDVRVTDVGLCGTEEIYYAAAMQDFDGGIMITGSHNPRDDNGMKFVRRGAVPISGDSGLHDIRDRALTLYAQQTAKKTAILPEANAEMSTQTSCGAYNTASFRAEYIKFLCDTVNLDSTSQLKIHCDPGHGCAGLVLRELLPLLPFQCSYAHMEPDGTFPDGVPNPLLPEKREATAKAVREHGADMGIAWDGDFDRCFFYDAEGNFIEGYYIVGLLAQSLLQDFPKSTIIHDPRLVWNTQDMVNKAGGHAVVSKTGHAFIKERMRAEDAVYGGEMSAHHYFRHFAYCDSGMLPWLLVAKLLMRSGKSLAALVQDCMQNYPCSGEINRKVHDAQAVMAQIQAHYAADALHIEHVDGLSMEFAHWRCNVRSSNTEPLLRLNVESRGDVALMQQKTAEILRFMQ